MLPIPPLNFQRNPVTLILLATMVALEVMGTIDPDSKIEFYAKWLGIRQEVWQWQLWRPFTTTLLHGGFIHALFNLYWFAVFGATVENWIGPFKTLALIVSFAFVSTMPQYVLTSYYYPPLPLPPAPNAVMLVVGFSGVNYALFGLLLIGRKYKPEMAMACGPDTVRWLLGWFFLCFVLSSRFLRLLPVANTAHTAGLVFGVLFGLTVFDARERLRWGAVLGVLSAVVLTTLFYCPGHRAYEAVRSRQLRAAAGPSVGNGLSAVPRRGHVRSTRLGDSRNATEGVPYSDSRNATEGVP